MMIMMLMMTMMLVMLIILILCRCETEYKIVEDKIYREECKVDVQHVCEEHLAVPVEHYPPIHDDYGPPDPYHHHENHPVDPHLLPKPDLFLSQAPDPHGLSPRQVDQQGTNTTEDPVLALLVTKPTKNPQTEKTTIRPRFAYDPTPGSKFFISPTPKPYTPDIPQPLFHARTKQVRGKRDSDLLASINASDDVLTDIVKKVLVTMFEKNQQLGEVKATIKQDRSIEPVNYHLNLPPEHPPHEQHDGLPDSPPIITTQELPAPPGCRSIATKECVKIPVTVPRQVPYSVCRTVPDIDCVHVLKSVPELQCTPEVFRDCADYEQNIPYLEEDEQCEEIIFDECLEVRKQLQPH